MENTKVSLAASIAARVFSAVVGLLALPAYISYLGLEAYGVVGVFTSIQVLIAFLDFGLAITLTRKLAPLSKDPGMLREARDVTRTFEVAYGMLAAAIALLLVILAGPLARTWVNIEALPATHVVFALQLAGASLACGWPANLYAAALAGLQRQLPIALSTSAFSLLRVCLTLVLLMHAPTLENFFWAQVIASAAQSAGTGMQLWRQLALPHHRPIVNWGFLSETRKFAGGITVISITAVVLQQMDKVILSHILPLSEFGVYAIATSLAASLYVVIAPVFSVIYARLSAVWCRDDGAALADLYHTSSQAMAVLILPVAAVLGFFPAQSLYVLTNDPVVSEAAARIFVLLLVGAVLNGLMNIPFALQLASGWTSLWMRTNVAVVVLAVPATWWAASRHGAIGGAAAWATLNAAYLLLTPHLLHRRLLPGEKWNWYRRDVCMPALVSVFVALLLASFVHPLLDSRFAVAGKLAACWLVVVSGAFISLDRLRALAKSAGARCTQRA